ncbi:hypothetical protein GGR55DRAFT_612420 [Xylaria sp. FL0064]|nr:hypothetical protein GGR55DRAFT_612420 [Xylaria sp. FL0064]
MLLILMAKRCHVQPKRLVVLMSWMLVQTDARTDNDEPRLSQPQASLPYAARRFFLTSLSHHPWRHPHKANRLHNPRRKF